MKTLNEYLAELKPLMGTDDPKERERFEEILSILKEQFTSVDDKKIITDFLNKGMDELGKDIKELTLKVQLSEISKMVSLSYIAKKYFNKSQSWLSQRINGNTIHNKPAKFTSEELATLQFALKDIGNILNSTVLTV